MTVKVTAGGRKRGRPRKRRKGDDDEKEREKEDEEEGESQSGVVEDDKEREAEAKEDGLNEVDSALASSWKMVSGTHSSADFTPFIAMFYFGLRRHSALQEEQEALEATANVFHLDEEQVLEHLSAFKELHRESL